ncbi:SURF1 family cytochrome oxidase biogenesis protein [Williamsia phyllosphaerae]|uniref:SURF1-like protein n=1 Tax=Williamsia phyllosphaerae TaxID=885042 RepID=A0ABQ1UWU8_9NOCA|nr:SURF1 family cytochrome oxidase biogenesis protein [Williamsia phyllosphaerae]GGF28924.1 SURF1-like protein [Williamsia phyllosphaerae]
MRILRAFVRPGWVALAIVVVGFALACFWVLAPWQLGKNTRTEHQNDLIKSAVTKSAVDIGTVYPGTGQIPTDTEWREVTVSGQYLPDKQAVVRLRSVDDSPAFEVLTPFRADDGRVFVVNRGYVRPQQGTALPPVSAAPSTPTSIEARIRAPEGTSPGRGPRIEAGVLQVYTIDPAVLGRQVGLPTMPAYLQLSSGQPGSLAEIPIPQLDAGPYLSYGLQWLAFGVMAPLGLFYFVWSEIKHRRTAAAQRAEVEARLGADAADAMPEASDAPVKRSRERRQTLTKASSVGMGQTRVKGTIGAGPDQQEAPDRIREKLASRYGD